MAGLPTSVAGQTMNPSFTGPNPAAYSSTPAIEALQDAFRRGLVDFKAIHDQVLKGKTDRMKGILADEEIRSSKDRQELAPEIHALNREKVRSGRNDLADKETQRGPENELLAMKQEQLRRAMKDAETDIPFSTEEKALLEIAHKTGDLKLAAQAFESRASRVPSKEVVPQVPPVTAENYRENLFAPEEPAYVNGEGFEIRPAPAETKVSPATAAQILRSIEPVLKLTPGQETFLTLGAKTGLGKEFYKDNVLRPEGEMAAIYTEHIAKLNEDTAKAEKELLKSQSKPLTAQQVAEERTAISQARQILSRMEEVRGLIFNIDPKGDPIVNADKSWSHSGKDNLVGFAPWLTSVSGVDAGAEMLGGDNRGQKKKITMLVNDLIREKAGAFKGSQSDKELKFLQATVPAIDADEKVWEGYLKEYMPVIRESIETREKNLSGESAATPAAPGKPRDTGWENAPVITTRAAWEKLAPGTKFVDAFGNESTKH